MAIYIKPGFWLKKDKPLGKGFLNLKTLITETVPPATTLTLGTDNQIPIVNAAGDDFEYTGLTYISSLGSLYIEGDDGDANIVSPNGNLISYTDATGLFKLFESMMEWDESLLSIKPDANNERVSINVSQINFGVVDSWGIQLGTSQATMQASEEVKLGDIEEAETGSQIKIDSANDTITITAETIQFEDLNNEIFTFLQGNLTAQRNYQMPDADGTLALTSDLLTLGTDNQIPFMNGTTDFEYVEGFKFNGSTSYPAITLTGISNTGSYGESHFLSERPSATAKVGGNSGNTPTGNYLYAYYGSTNSYFRAYHDKIRWRSSGAHSIYLEPQFSGTTDRTLTLPIGDGTIALTSDITKVYVANITQTSTSAPTATILKNDSGETITWQRSAVGLYYFELSGDYIGNTAFIVGSAGQNNSDGIFRSWRTYDSKADTTDFFVSSFNGTSLDTPVDDYIDNLTVKIEFY